VTEQTHRTHQDEVWDVDDGEEDHVFVVGEFGAHQICDPKSEKETCETGNG